MQVKDIQLIYVDDYHELNGDILKQVLPEFKTSELGFCYSTCKYVGVLYNDHKYKMSAGPTRRWPRQFQSDLKKLLEEANLDFDDEELDVMYLVKKILLNF